MEEINKMDRRKEIIRTYSLDLEHLEKVLKLKGEIRDVGLVKGSHCLSSYIEIETWEDCERDIVESYKPKNKR